MINPFDQIIMNSLGVNSAYLILIVILIFSVIIAMKDVRIGNIVGSLMLLMIFVLFYQLDPSNSSAWGPLLIAWFGSMVLLIITLLISYWGYEDRRKIIN